MSQEGLAAAVATQFEFLVHLGLRSFRQGLSIETGWLRVSGSLQFTQAILVVVPFIGKQFSTTHTTDWNDHFTL
jgi:hypothetical protein